MPRRPGHPPIRLKRRVVAAIVLAVWGFTMVGFSINKRAHGMVTHQQTNVVHAAPTEHVSAHQQRKHLLGRHELHSTAVHDDAGADNQPQQQLVDNVAPVAVAGQGIAVDTGGMDQQPAGKAGGVDAAVDTGGVDQQPAGEAGGVDAAVDTGGVDQQPAGEAGAEAAGDMDPSSTAAQATPSAADTATRGATTTATTAVTALPFAHHRRRKRPRPSTDAGYGDGYGVGDYFDYASDTVMIPEHTPHEDDTPLNLTAIHLGPDQAEAWVAADVAHALSPWLRDCIHARDVPSAIAATDASPSEQARLLEPLSASIRWATATAFAVTPTLHFCHNTLSLQTAVLQKAIAGALQAMVLGDEADEAHVVGLDEYKTVYQLVGPAHCSSINEAVQQAVAQAAAAAGGALC